MINSLKRIIAKTKRYFWRKTVQNIRKTPFYFWVYKSYWTSVFRNGKIYSKSNSYFSAVPNPGAGIGHQLANWIAGYWFANFFNLQFAHTPFPSEKWEYFLGFGENEITVGELIKNRKYKKVRLPLFDENNPKEIKRIKKIIGSYTDRKVVFIAEQDQFYRDQFGVMEQIRKKFHQASSRKDDQLIYLKDNFNIAIHVRRGDIVKGMQTIQNHRMRWQDNTYFEKVLTNVLSQLTREKKPEIYLFSQGEKADFLDFEKFGNIHYCLDMNAQDSFLHMVYADLLITSKSSFSYKPALLSHGIKVCPEDFWHGYPRSSDWLLVNTDGELPLIVHSKNKKNRFYAKFCHD